MPQLRRKTEKLGKGQLEDRKSGMMEENEISGKKKKFPFKERMSVCGCGVWRTDNGEWRADGGLGDGEWGPEPGLHSGKSL